MFSISTRLNVSRKSLFDFALVPLIPGCVTLNKLIYLKELLGSDGVCFNRFINTSSVEAKFRQHVTKCLLPVKVQHIYNDQNRLISSTPPKLQHPIGIWESHPKGKYEKTYPTREALRVGLKQLKFEVIKWKQEVRDAIAQDPLIVFPGDRDPVWVFTTHRRSPTSSGYSPNPSDEATPLNPITSLNTMPHDVTHFKSEFDGWMVSCDSDVNEGFSVAQLTASPAGHALFSGHLKTRIPEDGQIHYAGYCAMRSLRPSKSFSRSSFFDWSQYTHLVIRCRGDGRSYMINLATAGAFDVSWNDMYTYVLYTRGGPHWQTYKVPFSRFAFGSKGSIQDKQPILDPSKITSVGLASGDKINAPFRLEIDYIGVENDPIHSEETAYELYSFPAYYLTP